MKRKFTNLILLFALPFAACIKAYIPIPHPPQGGSPSSPTGNIPLGLSMSVNGMFSTFNGYPSVDTSDNSFTYFATGDSACCTNMRIAFGMNKFDNTPLTVGIYPASGFDLENQSEWTIYNYGPWDFTSNVGFLAYPDSVNITNITDSTITGTFSGTCTGEIMNESTNAYYDSVQTISNGKFYLRKY
jgi:hypothetical protein